MNFSPHKLCLLKAYAHTYRQTVSQTGKEELEGAIPSTYEKSSNSIAIHFRVPLLPAATKLLSMRLRHVWGKKCYLHCISERGSSTYVYVHTVCGNFLLFKIKAYENCQVQAELGDRT